ncbi:MAG: helix-turn-helix domain-containing protein [Planctomycetota bacterium]|nr:helix-turn-helix domain-containing protein [Planctomycetota bacterium]
MAHPAPQRLEIIDDPERASALLHPIRRRILSELHEPDSATGLARKLDLSRQKVNYHLRELEREGFVNLLEERNRRNCVERIMQATARSYIINPDVLGELGETPEGIRDRFSSAYLVASATQMVRDVATLRRRASEVGKSLATLTLQVDVRFATAKDRLGFTEELSNEIARLAAKYHDESAPDGRAYRFMLGAHPVITKSEAQAHAEKSKHQDGKEAPS